jgi:chromosome segregation ATPase
MMGGNCKNRRNRNQDYLASSKPSSPTIASPGYTITPEKQEKDLKPLLMIMMQEFKKDINNSFKELQEKTTKQVKESNKIIEDLKMEVDTIKKSQRETTLEIENLGKQSEAIDTRITNRIQEIEERISGAEDTIENIDTTVKKNAKCKKILNQNIQEIQDTRRPNFRIIGLDENEVNIFNKIIEENLPKEKDAHEHTRSLQNYK